MFLNSQGTKEVQLRHDTRYIYWHKEAEKIQVSWDTWNELVEDLQQKGKEVPDVVGSRSVRSLWGKDKSYKFDDNRKDPTLYVSEVVDGKQKLSVYFTYLDADKASRPKGAGSAGFNLMKSYFLEENGITMEQAFGEVAVKNGHTVFDKCVSRVKYAIYLRRSIKGMIVNNLYKADISSAWPSEICDDLPDRNKTKTVKGRVLPDEEYPIAYYVKSGHIAEYGKYDTHDWLDNIWYKEIESQSKDNFKPHKGHSQWETFETIDDDEEETVLFGKSKYTLRGPIEKLYTEKESANDIFTKMWAKAMLNAFIGYMRSNEYNPYHWMGHLSALAYARATNRMLTMADTLTKEGSLPIYMAIDSIIWTGNKSSLTSNKKLGAFVSEAEAARGVIINHGQYCLEKDGQLIFEKHQGIDSSVYDNKDISNLDEYIKQMGQPTQEKTTYDKEKHQFVIRRVINV